VNFIDKLSIQRVLDQDRFELRPGDVRPALGNRNEVRHWATTHGDPYASARGNLSQYFGDVVAKLPLGNFPIRPCHATTVALRSSTRVNLSPLTETETAKLVANLLEQAVLPAEVQSAILARSGGNPLYAEEFVRLLKDRDILR
jgi:hypothetical protein